MQNLANSQFYKSKSLENLTLESKDLNLIQAKHLIQNLIDQSAVYETKTPISPTTIASLKKLEATLSAEKEICMDWINHDLRYDFPYLIPKAKELVNCINETKKRLDFLRTNLTIGSLLPKHYMATLESIRGLIVKADQMGNDLLYMMNIDIPAAD